MRLLGHLQCVLMFTAATAQRFFRIDQGQESEHFITDISSEDLYILDPELTPPAPEPVSS